MFELTLGSTNMYRAFSVIVIASQSGAAQRSPWTAGQRCSAADPETPHLHAPAAKHGDSIPMPSHCIASLSLLSMISELQLQAVKHEHGKRPRLNSGARDRYPRSAIARRTRFACYVPVRWMQQPKTVAYCRRRGFTRL